MAKACKKCDPHEICEECPEWIFTLADLIMCMMGLFVILWVLKPGTTQPPPPSQSADAGKAQKDYWLDLQLFSAGVAGRELDPNDPIDQELIRRRAARNAGLGGETNEKRETPEGTDPMSQSVRPGKEALVGGRLLFEANGTRFTPETTRALNEIAKIIRGHRNIVLVKGHTSLDDFPDDASAEEKMKLSLLRAQQVADYLVSQKVEPDILRVQGCSTFEPVKQRAYTADALQMNRRVEVITTASLVEDLQDKANATPASAPAPAPAKSGGHSGH